MVNVKKGDFIELEYTGRTKADNRIFDTTNEDVLKKEGIEGHNINYGPITICVGEKNVLPYLDNQLENKEIGKVYDIGISAKDAFGNKDPKLIRVISMSLFKKQNINPYPGLQINAEGHLGIVKSVNGGRIMVDFNHPLAGKDIFYSFKIIKKVEDVQKQVECIAKFNLFPDPKIYQLDTQDNKLTVTCKIDLPEQLKNNFKNKLNKLVPNIRDIEFYREKKINTEE